VDRHNEVVSLSKRVRSRASRAIVAAFAAASVTAATFAGCVSEDAHTIVGQITGSGGSGGGGACSTPDDCDGADTSCSGRTCEAGVCGFANSPAGTTCDDAGGALCDGAGSCVECVNDGDCATAGDACNGGTCVPATCTDGFANPPETDVDCGGPDCARCADGAVCLEDGDCESVFCDDASGTCAPCVADADCEPYACQNGSCLTSCVDEADCDSVNWCEGDVCVPDKTLGEPCGGFVECSSGSCVDGVCCDAPCLGGCESCTMTGACVSHAQGDSGDPSCTPLVCNGVGGDCPATCSADSDCVAGNYCNAGSCLPVGVLGALCSTPNACATGNCADGRCCNTGCVNACDACDSVGSEGFCTPKSDGSAGDPACDPYLCSGTATCPMSCSVGADCIAGHFCGGGLCLPLEPPGSPCSSGLECQSGFCADGVCCDSACTDACDTCGLSGFEGSCLLLVSGSSGSPSCTPYVCDGAMAPCPMSCAADAGCVSGRYCDGGTSSCLLKKSNGSTCGGVNECQSGNCADGYCCNTQCGSGCDICNAAGSEGTCLPAAPGSSGAPTCSPYVCDGAGAACPNFCATSANCAAGFTCNGMGQCV
jgi:hypothetical protein